MYKNLKGAFGVILFSILGFQTGCQTATPEPTYDEVSEKISASEEVSIATIVDAFVSDPNFPQKLQKIAPLERQAIQLAIDEPLKIGSIGNAILETYYGSLPGHYAMMKFYERVDSEEAAAVHRGWIKRIQDYIEEGATGSKSQPYRVLSASEAHMYLVTRGLTAVGSMYQSSESMPFGLYLVARPDNKTRLGNYFFDLTPAYVAVANEFAGESTAEFSPQILISYLAKQNDTAAQAAIGTYFTLAKDWDSAIDWLHAASRSSNLMANLMLARVHWNRAESLTDTAKDEEMSMVLDNYLSAVAMGSDEAMLRLAGLYLTGSYGEDNKASGLPLLNQAVELENLDATLYLAHMNYRGDYLEQDLQQADKYYRLAAGTGNPQARITYVRFLMDDKAQPYANKQALTWLEEVAEEDNPNAMLLLGYAHAKGLGVNANQRTALRWFKSALGKAPEDPEIINEIAWTLTVTDRPKLRREKYALKIMDKMMSTNLEAAENPAYLDTLAAANAANGDFERAIELQQKAVSQAKAKEQTDVIEVLEEHLQLFIEGQSLTDKVP